jgi:predicted GIY-YIG superfamily endonuclease
MKPFFVYMLRCRDGSYYVGHTDDLERRMDQHETGLCDGHTARRRPVTLVWFAETETREEAIARELQFKTWSRAKKAALVRGDWDAVRALARGRNASERGGTRSTVAEARPSTPRVPAARATLGANGAQLAPGPLPGSGLATASGPLPGSGLATASGPLPGSGLATASGPLTGSRPAPGLGSLTGSPSAPAPAQPFDSPPAPARRTQRG